MIENGVDPDIAATAPQRQAARALLGLPGDAPIIGTVGRLAPQKGQRDLVRALPSIRAAIPGTLIVIAGDGPLRGPLEDEARRAGVSDAVHFLGHRDVVPVILSALDLFVLPSLWEGLPLSLLEAMSMSLPVVATRAVGIEETVTDGVEGSSCRDPGALARAAAPAGDRHLALGFGAPAGAAWSGAFARGGGGRIDASPSRPGGAGDDGAAALRAAASRLPPLRAFAPAS